MTSPSRLIRTAAVAGIDDCVGLNVILRLDVALRGVTGDQALEGADVAKCDAEGQIHGMADGDDKLPHAQLARIAQAGGDQFGPFGSDFHHGDVRLRIRSHQLSGEFLPTPSRTLIPSLAALSTT